MEPGNYHAAFFVQNYSSSQLTRYKISIYVVTLKYPELMKYFYLQATQFQRFFYRFYETIMSPVSLSRFLSFSAIPT